MRLLIKPAMTGREQTMRLSVLAVFTLVAIIPIALPAAAFPSEYVIEPAYGAIGTPSPDLCQTTFWDLSLREMAIVSVLAISPLFIFPVEILFMLKIFFCLGFRRISRSNILDSDSRQSVFAGIQASPGIRITELVKKTGLSRGTVNYHLAVLRFNGKITYLRTNGEISYFENSQKYEPAERKVIRYLRNETEMLIFRALMECPRASRADLEKLLALSGPTVTWHMKRLCADGMVRVSREGRYSRYTLPETIKKYVGDNLGAVSGYRCGRSEQPSCETGPRAAKA